MINFVFILQLAMRGPPGPMGLTGRSGPVVSNLFLQLTSMTFHKNHPRTVKLPQGTCNKSNCNETCSELRSFSQHVLLYCDKVIKFYGTISFPLKFKQSREVHRCIAAKFQPDRLSENVVASAFLGLSVSVHTTCLLLSWC